MGSEGTSGMKRVHALFVDDEVELAERYAENLTIALRDVAGVEMSAEFASRVEAAKNMLPPEQSRFQLVVVDMLWPSSQTASGFEARGFEVIEQAKLTPGTVVVAFSVGNT